MKRIISAILTVALLLSMSVMSTLSTSAADIDIEAVGVKTVDSMKKVLDNLEISKSEKPEIATTSVRTFSVSEEAGVSFETIDGCVYGYVGDADGDDTISVMDATAIQLHCAETQVMLSIANKLSDVDMDDQTTVMDATAIQLHLASIKESEYIHHVLYTPLDNYDPVVDTFDEIAEFLTNSGTYDEELNTYYLDQYIEEGADNSYISFDYFPDYDTLSIYTSTYIADNDCYLDSSFRVVRGDMTFKLCTTMYSGDITLYSSTSKGNVVEITDEYDIIIELEYEEFSSDYGLTIEYLDESLKMLAAVSIVTMQEFINYDVVGLAFDLVYDLQSLL